MPRSAEELLTDRFTTRSRRSRPVGAAQIEADSRRAGFTNVDLSAIFDAVAEAYGPVAKDRRQIIATRITPGTSNVCHSQARSSPRNPDVGRGGRIIRDQECARCLVKPT